MHRKNNHYLLLALLFHFQNVVTFAVLVNIHKNPEEVGSIDGGILHVPVEKTGPGGLSILFKATQQEHGGIWVYYLVTDSRYRTSL